MEITTTRALRLIDELANCMEEDCTSTLKRLDTLLEQLSEEPDNLAFVKCAKEAKKLILKFRYT